MSKRENPAVEEGTNKKQKLDYVIPSDWPALEGPIDLAVQDLPHASSQTEWWYVNSHVKDAEGKQYSLHIAFFRVASGRTVDGKPEHFHSLTANIVDVDGKVADFFSYLDEKTPKILKWQLEHDQYHLDPRLSNAMLEIVSKDSVPLPDFHRKETATISESGLVNLDYKGGNTFVSNPDGSYRTTANCPEKNMGFDLTLVPLKPAVRQGNNGIVQVGLRQETMFYYFIPRTSAKGTLTWGGKTFEISGEGWYDHEFGGGIRTGVYDYEDETVERPAAQIAPDAAVSLAAGGEATADEDKTMADTTTAVKDTSKEKDDSLAWNWFSMQLDNGCDITATNLVDIVSNEVRDNFLIIIDEKGDRIEYTDMVVESSDPWMSVRSGNTYPLQWKLTVPSGEIELHLKAVIANQEVFTLLSRPAYWEGRLDVTGTIKGKDITGRCFLERHGFEEIASLDYFFKNVSKLVRKEIWDVIPREPTRQDVVNILANDDNTHYLDGVSIPVFTKTIVDPLRDVIDRGGKSWRSYALLLCIDAVGGNSFKYQHWLAMPEMMHVGSLIIDDIQDKSELRRGLPCCHKIHGESISINAGTAAYFLAMHLLQSRTPDMTPEERNYLYDLYFLTLRAGHCGQAFDIYGLEYRLEAALKSGDMPDLLTAVIGTHRLKSAVPAGNLAKMGAKIGKGSELQIEALGNYFEQLGIAFQIIDDVLNLSGQEDQGQTLKSCGEDLHEGKITYPVARALCSFGQEEREQFWNVLKSKPDYPEVAKLIKQLTAPNINALEASRQDARDMVEKAYKQLDSAIPDSYYKIMLRAFGFYVLERFVPAPYLFHRLYNT